MEEVVLEGAELRQRDRVGGAVEDRRLEQRCAVDRDDGRGVVERVEVLGAVVLGDGKPVLAQPDRYVG